MRVLYRVKTHTEKDLTSLKPLVGYRTTSFQAHYILYVYYAEHHLTCLSMCTELREFTMPWRGTFYKFNGLVFAVRWGYLTKRYKPLTSGSSRCLEQAMVSWGRAACLTWARDRSAPTNKQGTLPMHHMRHVALYRYIIMGALSWRAYVNFIIPGIHMFP